MSNNPPIFHAISWRYMVKIQEIKTNWRQVQTCHLKVGLRLLEINYCFWKIVSRDEESPPCLKVGSRFWSNERGRETSITHLEIGAHFWVMTHDMLQEEVPLQTHSPLRIKSTCLTSFVLFKGKYNEDTRKITVCTRLQKWPSNGSQMGFGLGQNTHFWLVNLVGRDMAAVPVYLFFFWKSKLLGFQPFYTPTKRVLA